MQKHLGCHTETRNNGSLAVQVSKGSKALTRSQPTLKSSAEREEEQCAAKPEIKADPDRVPPARTDHPIFSSIPRYPRSVALQLPRVLALRSSHRADSASRGPAIPSPLIISTQQLLLLSPRAVQSIPPPQTQRWEAAAGAGGGRILASAGSAVQQRPSSSPHSFDCSPPSLPVSPSCASS